VGFRSFRRGFLRLSPRLCGNRAFVGSLNKAASGLSSLCDRHCQRSRSVFVEENHTQGPRSERTLTLCERSFSTLHPTYYHSYGTLFQSDLAPFWRSLRRGLAAFVSLAVVSAFIVGLSHCRDARKSWGRWLQVTSAVVDRELGGWEVRRWQSERNRGRHMCARLKTSLLGGRGAHLVHVQAEAHEAEDLNGFPVKGQCRNPQTSAKSRSTTARSACSHRPQALRASRQMRQSDNEPLTQQQAKPEGGQARGEGSARTAPNPTETCAVL